MTSPLDDLPNVSAWFDEPDEQAVPLLIAIGRLVWAGAGVEKVLQMAIAQISIEQGGKLLPGDHLARLDRMTGGQLLGELRKLDVPAALANRITDVVDRRNETIHRMYANADIVRAAGLCEGGGERLDVASQPLPLSVSSRLSAKRLGGAAARRGWGPRRPGEAGG